MEIVNNKIDLLENSILLNVLKKIVHRQFFYCAFRSVINNAFLSLT